MPRYSDDELLAFMREAHQETDSGRFLFQSAYARYRRAQAAAGRDLPTAQTIAARFRNPRYPTYNGRNMSGWNHAEIKAGLRGEKAERELEQLEAVLAALVPPTRP